MNNSDYIRGLGEIALGSRLKRISDRFNQEISKIFRSQNLDIEPSWLPVLLYLDENDSASVSEIAAAMYFTHPAVIHLLKQMEKRRLLETFTDAGDKRKRIVKLSGTGVNVLSTAGPLLNEIKLSVGDLMNSGSYNFVFLMDYLEEALGGKNFYRLTEERIKKRMIDSVDILKYSPRYKEQFKLLNTEWLEKYFNVEPEDERILNNPKDIISGGGEIFFASLNGNIIGTCAVIKKNGEEYELAKMAVTEKARGKQAGKKLALAAIGFAYSKGAKFLVLETSQKLHAAVGLYENLGFEYISNDGVSKYERTTIKMKMDLASA